MILSTSYIVHGISCDLLILAFSVALCTGDTDLKELLKHCCGCNLAPHMVVPGSWNSLKFICFLNMTDWGVKVFGLVILSTYIYNSCDPFVEKFISYSCPHTYPCFAIFQNYLEFSILNSS